LAKHNHTTRRQDIAAGAARLIANHGIEKLTVRQIARELDCSTGVLSHYFANKDEIVLAALNWANEPISLQIADLRDEDIQFSLLLDLLPAILPLTEDNEIKWRVRISLWSYSLSREELIDQQRQRTQSWKAIISDLLVRLQEKNEILPNIDPAPIATTLANLISGTGFNLLFLPLEERTAACQHIQLFLKTLQTQYQA